MGRKRKRRRNRDEPSQASSVPLTPEARDAIGDWAEEAADVNGYNLWDVEITHHGKWIVRVFIDRDDSKPGKGINVSECAQVSRYIEALFDADERTPEVYVMEVSSPGIERPLKKPSHYDRVVGQDVELVLREPILGKNKVVGRLLAHEDGQLTIKVEDEPFDVDLETVARAKLKFDFSKESGDR